MSAEFPLLLRAWCFQERLLSPRLLHFAAGELMWERSASTACQCHPRYRGILPLMAHDSKKLFTESETLWANIVRAHSALSLSFEQDKLPALSGVAKYILKQRPGDEYLIGMWRKTLLVDLRWQACGLAKRPARWRSPSWSWASIDGEIDILSTAETARVRNFCTLGSASVTLAGPDPTGAVTNGELFLSAPAFVAVVHEELSSGSSVDTFSLQGGGLSVIFHADCCADFEQGLLAVGDQLLCLLLGGSNPGWSDFCLVLKPCEEYETYRRVGYVYHAGTELHTHWYPADKEDIVVRIV